jgi:FkbM family methyltransferase
MTKKQASSVSRIITPPNSKEFSIVVGKNPDDEIAIAILENKYQFPRHYQMLFDIVQPNGFVLDLGAHIGTFSLMAGASGYHVISVEASSRNANLLKESIRINDFKNVKLVQAAISDREGSMEFIQDGPYGMVANPNVKGKRQTTTVPSITVDLLLAQNHWKNVGMVKMDIEGSEVNAIKGMTNLLSMQEAPILLFESNGHTLNMFGESPGSLFAALEAYGYTCYHYYSGKLYPISSQDMQLECVADCVAAKLFPDSFTEKWEIASAMPLAQKIQMILGSLMHPIDDVRAYIGRTLSRADRTILGDGRISRALETLRGDPVEDVRQSISWWNRYIFQPVSLPDGKSVDLALPVGSNDPIVQRYADNDSSNSYLIHLMLRFTQPGGRVLDLGCHVGTFSVPAAALDRNVIAVDASLLHVGSVRLAARRNHLENLHVEWCAITDRSGKIEFNENGIWGRVAREAGSAPGRMKVPARRGEKIVTSSGWSHLDFVKMDIQGSELAAIESLGRFLRGPKAPIIVYESNGMTFDVFGYTISDIRRRLESLGYVTCRMEGSDLVYCPPMELQPEAWIDMLALPPSWQKKGTSIVPNWSTEAMVQRCIQWGTNESVNIREYLHRSFESNLDYPKNNKRINKLRKKLTAEFAKIS